MPDLGRIRPALERACVAVRGGGAIPVVLVCAAVGALAAAGLLWSQHRLSVSGADPVAALPRAVRVTTTQPPAPPLVVHVAGSVERPGLVEVPEGARVADAVVAAGGLRADADDVRINLAEKLVDGARLYVPAVGEIAPPVAAGTSGGAGSSATPSAAAPLDLNAAAADQLDELPGVGPATAAAIVAHREANGRFTSVDALADVRGIGPAKLEAIRPLVRVCMATGLGGGLGGGLDDPVLGATGGPEDPPGPWVVGDGWVCACAAATALGALWARPLPLALPLGLFAVAAWRRGRLLLVTGLLLLTAALGHRALAGLDPAVAGPVQGAAVLVTDPERMVAGTRAIARFDGQRVELWARGAPAGRLARALAGEVVELRGRRTPLAASQIEGRAWRRLVGTVDVDSVEDVRPGAVPYRLANEIHRRLERGARSLDPDDRSLLAGLVLGDDRAQPAVLRDAFDAVGLSHLLAVSGQNVAFVLAAFGPFLHRMRLAARWAAIVALLGFFALVTRFEPSVLRAVAMALLAATAAALGRPAPGIRVLSLAVCGLLVVDPLLVRSIGFQLSVLASAGILLLAPPVARRLPLPVPLAMAIAVPFAAQVATSPLLVALQGGIPAVAMPANVLVEPAAGLVMTWGSSAGLVAGYLPGPLAALVTLPSRVLLDWIAFVATRCARLPPCTIDARRLVLLALVGVAGPALRGARRAAHRWPAAGSPQPDAAGGGTREADAEAESGGASSAESPPRRARRVLVVAVASVVVLGVARPNPGSGVRLPEGAELHRAGSVEVLVIGRPLDGARLLRALRGRIAGDVELLVVRSPSGGAWRSAQDVLGRYDVHRVLAPLPRPGVTATTAPVTIEAGGAGASLVVDVTVARTGDGEPRLDVTISGGAAPDGR